MSFRLLLENWRLSREFGAFTREFGAFTREFPTFTREFGAFTRDFCRSLPYFFIKITTQIRVDRMDLFWYYSYSG
ncbi:hypothetical protein V2I71_23630 [Peribacillus frigoritolerans]|uniref:hypothetical protein n=1 Tax=Peribacillus frigoritolerans TaxID=450367 RepID=UPI002ED43381|nr:hypothetical protein V2I71_23630 [Peribacillus frigoritolerans]